jgi:hypothetical protein
MKLLFLCHLPSYIAQKSAKLKRLNYYHLGLNKASVQSKDRNLSDVLPQFPLTSMKTEEEILGERIRCHQMQQGIRTPHRTEGQ